MNTRLTGRNSPRGARTRFEFRRARRGRPGITSHEGLGANAAHIDETMHQNDQRPMREDVTKVVCPHQWR